MGQGSVRLHSHHLRAHARLRLRIVQYHHLALGIALTILFLLLLLGLDGHLLLIRLAKILAVIPLVQLKFLFPWLLLLVSSLAAVYISRRSLAVALALAFCRVLASSILVVLCGRLEVWVHVRVLRVLRNVDR